MELELTIESKETGAVETKRLAVDGRLTLGRGPESPVALEGNGLSREHLAFEAVAGGVHVLDVSVNGTWVNGRRLGPGKGAAVSGADRIEIPGYAIRCTLLAAVPVPAAAASALAASLQPAPSTIGAALASVTVLEKWTLALVLAAFAVLLIFWKV